jgi:hypothetical protein
VKRSVRLLVQGVVCLGVAAAAASIAPSAASAAASVPASTTVQAPATTTTTTTYAVPAATCARIRAQFPDKAADPRICTGTHIEKRTLAPSSAGAKTATAVQPASCFYGTAWFDDEYVEFPGLFSTQMKSTFTYRGCVNPTVVINWCYVNYSRFGYSVSNLSCGNYTTGIPSRAALQTGWANEPAGWGGFRFWQRRECYTGGPGTCNWNWG